MRLTGWPLAAAAGVGLLAAWYVWRDDLMPMPGTGHGRDITRPADSRGELVVGPRVTPDHLLHFGPPVLPSHWVKHRLSYSTTPGVELQRIMYGAPGAYACAVPYAERGWLFNPPAEKDY